jgi:hypothetical protein
MDRMIRIERRLFPYRCLILSILSTPTIVGCARVGDDDLVIATTWPQSERAALEAGFQRWMASRNEGGPVRIGWIALAPSDDPARVARRRWPVDLLLGGPASSYRQMEREGRLVPAGVAGRPAWLAARRSPVVLAMNARTDTSQPDRSRSEVTFNDPRHDPVALAWAQGVLKAGEWTEGYARLVRWGGSSRPISRTPGAALAAVERREVERTPAVLPPGPERPATLVFLPEDDAAGWVEGIAALRGGRHPERAQEFLRYVAGRSQADPPGRPPDGPEADDLLADLLGATIVDAQDELRTAWATVHDSGEPERLARWMAEPPPWPPASVAVLLDRGEDGMAMLDTLAAEIAPETDVRAWLLRSWLRTPLPIDGPFLAQLAGAVDGRLAREHRFRAWLKAEWTAWARQRYRRARLANGAPLW